MGIFYLLLFALILWGIKVNKNGFNEDYLGRTQCNAIKGIFIVVVFLRHVVPYVKKAGYDMQSPLDLIYKLINWQVGQLLVVMFLFYSGYGVMESIKKKGIDYIASIPRRRVLTTFINFDIAVSLFLVMDFALGIDVTAEKYLLSRIGWDSIGNSNWYIFIIMLCYISTYFAFKLCRGGGILCLSTILIIAIIILFVVKKPHWYNTLLSYPAGMFFSLYHDRFEAIAKHNYFKFLWNSIGLLVLLHILNLILHRNVIYAYTYNIESILFALLVVLITMKVSIGNIVLRWLGINLFPLYIYQRMPMVAMREIAGGEWLCAHPYQFVIISLIVSVILGYLYRYWKISL